MEAAISAIAGELINRCISFLTRKYKDMTGADDKLERLQQLLLRIHAVVEEADGRYITNIKMLMQLKLIAESMYQGYNMLDTAKYRFLPESVEEEEGSSSTASTLSTTSSPMKRLRTISGATRGIVLSHDLQSALDNLEAVVSGRPYDTYLYTDNFMFGRHVEKQRIINILLQNPRDPCAPMVLPVIGRYKVGKRTLIRHVRNDERVRCHFSSFLYINGDSICTIDQAQFRDDKILIIVEFASDVDDEDWVKFYSSVTRMGGSGSKVIVISRLQNVAFGSTDARDFPQLASIANKLATELGGSLIPANAIADLLRRNQDIKFWLRILQRFKGIMAHNIAMFGEQPRNMLEKDHPIHITGFTSSSCPIPLRFMPPRVRRDDDPPRRKLPHVMFGELIAGLTAIPNEEFEIVSWESRIPPYTKFVHSVEAYIEEKHECTTPTGKRRWSN